MERFGEQCHNSVKKYVQSGDVLLLGKTDKENAGQKISVLNAHEHGSNRGEDTNVNILSKYEVSCGDVFLMK